MDVSGSDRGARDFSRAETVARPLVIEKVLAWNDAAEAGLSQTFGNDRDLIVLGVGVGTLELWKLWGGEAWAVTRVELGVLTCCCYQGCNCREWMGWLMEQGRRMGLHAIQFYTARRGLARLLGDFGFVAQETVYRAAVK